jgi:tRNA 2-thiouridine synthesizing protein E
MPELRIGDRLVRIDDHGFLLEPGDWNEEVAAALAEYSSLPPLQDDHWQVIRYIREYFRENNTAPMLRLISKRTGLGENRLKTMFPQSCRECMCKIAGLPQPTG